MTADTAPPNLANIRDAFGDAVLELGGDYPDLIVLTDDLMYPTRTNKFAERYPERMVNLGIAEQNMIGVAAGLATAGLLPLVASYSVFLAFRAGEQVRDDIAYPNLNVKLAGLASGVTAGGAGPTHQTYEDVALMRAIPNMIVIVPSDAQSTRSALRAALEWKGPVFLRLGRDEERVVHAPGLSFDIGKAHCLRDGDDVALLANGSMVAEACDAADRLSEEGIQARVLEIHTVKPIDREAIESCGREVRAIITVEEHSIYGGLGAAVLEVLQAATKPPVTCMGIRDVFPPLGPTFEVRRYLGLDAGSIATTAMSLLERSGR